MTYDHSYSEISGVVTQRERKQRLQFWRWQLADWGGISGKTSCWLKFGISYPVHVIHSHSLWAILFRACNQSLERGKICQVGKNTLIRSNLWRWPSVCAESRGKFDINNVQFGLGNSMYWVWSTGNRYWRRISRSASPAFASVASDI